MEIYQSSGGRNLNRTFGPAAVYQEGLSVAAVGGPRLAWECASLALVLLKLVNLKLKFIGGKYP